MALAVFGLIKGEGVIRDPGQKFETGLVMFYLVGGIIMLANGWMTHQQAMQQFEELAEEDGGAPSTSSAVGVEEE